MDHRIVVLDNGSEKCKVGFATSTGQPSLVPNYAVRPKREKRLYIADQCDEVTDLSGLFFRRPMDRGLIVNWELETLIWKQMFSSPTSGVQVTDPSSVSLCLLEPPLSMQHKEMMELIFERVGFHSTHRAISSIHTPSLFYRPDLAGAAAADSDTMADARAGDVPQTIASRLQAAVTAAQISLPANYPILKYPCSVIIDVGFSGTNIIPTVHGRPVRRAIRRLNIGGKVMTNYLKELISYRQFNVLEETCLVNDAKEKACYVFTRMDEDMTLPKNRRRQHQLRADYVLPSDGQRYGYVREPPPLGSAQNDSDDQVISLISERYSVPELLFHPSDIGSSQAGLPEMVLDAISACAPVVQGPMWSSILLLGASSQFVGLATRLETELRRLAPTDIPVHVMRTPHPAVCGWIGSLNWVRDELHLPAVHPLTLNVPQGTAGTPTRADIDALIGRHFITKAEWEEAGESILARKCQI